MPVPADIAQINPRHRVECVYILQSDERRQGTISNSSLDFFYRLQSYPLLNESNTKYLKLGVEFEKEIKLKKESFENISIQEERKKFNEITSTFLDFNPDKFSFELTYEGGVFFTLKKGSFSFYIQYFFETDSDESEEVLLSVFKDKTKLPSYAGNIAEIVSEMKYILDSKGVVLI